jgi:phytoene synthase
VEPQEILECRHSERFEQLAAEVARRARTHYSNAHQLLPPEDRRAMVPAEVMGSVYWRLLRRIESRQFRVLGPDLIRVHKATKLALILRTWVRTLLSRTTPNYGAD